MGYKFPDMLSCSSIQHLFLQLGIKEFEPLPPLGKFTRKKTITKKIDVIPHAEYVEFAKSLESNGVSVSLENLSENSENGLIELNGITSCIYMKNQRPDIFYDNGYTYHLFICQGVKEQININKKDRYVAISRDDGLFPVIVSGRSAKERKEVHLRGFFPLRLCGYCKHILMQRGLYRDNFSLKEFLKNHKPELQYSFQREEVVTVEDNYTPTWKEISIRCRENVHYKCTVCKVDCSSHRDCLEVHHKNFVRNDNRLTNLAVLCTDCHSKCPNHDIVKRERGDKIKIIERLRKEQNLL